MIENYRFIQASDLLDFNERKKQLLLQSMMPTSFYEVGLPMFEKY